MRKQLLVVEEAFNARGRGAIVVPILPHDGTLIGRRALSVPVELHLPGGTVASAAARLMPSHLSYASYAPRQPPWIVACCLMGMTAGEVPAGTEVWYDDDELARIRADSGRET